MLVVEDDEDTRELVRATLEDAGAQVEAVGTPARRGGKCSESPGRPDIGYPHAGRGRLLADAVAAQAGVTTPAIALTATRGRRMRTRRVAAGFQIHLAKPVDAARLVEAVATLHEQRTIH